MLVIRELEDPGGRDMTPFPWEDAVMPFYDGHPPPPGRRRVSNLSPATPTRCGWGHEDIGV
jgi:hypothetical protein